MKELDHMQENEKENTGKLTVYLKRLQKSLAHNLGWKILSLILALVLWMAIMDIDDPYITTTIENIPVQVLNENALEEQGKISDIESGKQITIKVRAPKSVADSLTATDFTAVADYRQMSLVYAVPIQVSVSENSSYAREDITIEEKSTEVMQLTLEDYASETFRVDIAAIGTAKDGYYVTEMSAKPNLIQISGSKKQIDRIAKVVVEINISNVWKSFQTVAMPKAYDINGYLIDEKTLEFETTTIEVDVTVLPVKTILLLVTTEGEPSYGYECTGTQYVPNEITVAGSLEDLQSIYSLTIPFDISMQSGEVEAKLNIENYLAEAYGDKYVLVDEEKYVTVKATIEKLPTVDIKVGSDDIEVRNLDEGYHLIFTTKSDINIKVLGHETELSALTPESLRLYIDVADYEPGSHYVSVYSDTEADVMVRTGTIGIEITEVVDTMEVIQGGGQGNTETQEPDADPDDFDGGASEESGVEEPEAEVPQM
ncbi:MAG: hypothetical protein IJY09_05745 [Lachnospiraceae bacterium]|nr:hypothetical protein [Lachnospiraceae bacterium]